MKSRIAHGTPAGDDTRPYQVFIKAAEDTGHIYYASGSLIQTDTTSSSNWILTCAHCVTKENSIEIIDSLTISAGSVDLRGNGLQTRELRAGSLNYKHPDETVFVPRQFNPSMTWNGYGLYKCINLIAVNKMNYNGLNSYSLLRQEMI